MKNENESAALRKAIEPYPFANAVARLRLTEALLSARDYNVLQRALWASKSHADDADVTNAVGIIYSGSERVRQKSSLKELFLRCRKELLRTIGAIQEPLVLEDLLLISTAADTTERELVWDQGKATDWMQGAERINHWLLDDVFVAACIGKLGSWWMNELGQWFCELVEREGPHQCAYSLEKKLAAYHPLRTEDWDVLNAVAGQLAGGRWQAATDAHNKGGGPRRDLRAFAAAGLDVVEFLPLLGKDGCTPRFGEIHDPLHQGGTAYFGSSHSWKRAGG